MEQRSLGLTGARVPTICLGTMTFGLQCDEETSFAILDAAFAAGVDFFDTADVYPLGSDLELNGETERIIGRWMQSRGCRDSIFLATKCRGKMGEGANDAGLSRYHIQRAVEESLRRLQTDVVDLYQTHFFDPHTPIDETLGALDDLVHQGKVRYIGCSNYPAWRLSEALEASKRLGLARYQSLQPRYNLLYREIETEVLPLVQDAGVGVIVYNPIAGGLLAGKYRAGEAPREGTRFTLGNSAAMYQRRYWDEVQLDAVDALRVAAEERDVSLATVAVAWVLAQPGITSAIIGASKPQQLDATVAGADLDLDDEMRTLCDEVWWKLPRREVLEGYR
ncbi:MAG: aldo/keto reductase [Acidobacteriota bacterium]|nr:aldo/keto reductase [Acidobacteriota bacterium]